MEPRERVGSLRATGVGFGGGGWAKFLSGGTGDVPKALAGCGKVWEVEWVVLREMELKKWGGAERGGVWKNLRCEKGVLGRRRSEGGVTTLF